MDFTMIKQPSWYLIKVCSLNYNLIYAFKINRLVQQFDQETCTAAIKSGWGRGHYLVLQRFTYRLYQGDQNILHVEYQDKDDQLQLHMYLDMPVNSRKKKSNVNYRVQCNQTWLST